jgi:hypothetical protein
MTAEQQPQQSEGPAAPGAGETFAEQFETPMTVAKMHGSLMEVVRGCFRILPDRWDSCSAGVQQDAIDRASMAIDKATRKAVDMLAGQLRATVPVEIDSVKFGDKIQITCVANKGSEHRHAIADASKGDALLVLPNYPVRSNARAGDSTPAKPDAAALTIDLFDDGAPKPAGETTSENSEANSENSEVAGTVTGDGTGEALPPIAGPFTAYIEGQQVPKTDGDDPDDGDGPKFE